MLIIKAKSTNPVGLQPKGSYVSYTSRRVLLIMGKAPIGSLWAPPKGSGMMWSITPNLISSGAVIFNASVAYMMILLMLWKL